MQLRRPTVMKVMLLSTSFFLTFFNFYSANVYIRVYESTRNFDVSTPELKVMILNASHASMETTMTLLNPSRSKFELVQVIEGIRLNGRFIKQGRFLAPGESLELHPNSNVTITIETDIPPYLINYVSSRIERAWFIDVRITLSTEIVGKFPWRGTWLISGVQGLELPYI